MKNNMRVIGMEQTQTRLGKINMIVRSKVCVLLQ